MRIGMPLLLRFLAIFQRNDLMGLTVQSMSAVMPKPVSDNPSFATTRPAQTPEVFPGQIFSGDARTPRHERSVHQIRGATGDGPTKASRQGPGDNQRLDREKRGQVLGACARSDFRECRGGEDLLDLSTAHEHFDQSDHARTRTGPDGKGSCQGVAFEALRRVDRATDGASAPDTLPAAISHMNSDMDTLSASHPGGIYDRIDGFQSGSRLPPLANYRQSSSANFNVDGSTDRSTRIDGLIQSLTDDTMPQGGLAYVRLGIRRADSMGSAEPYGHALVIQHLPGGSQYVLFDPNNGAFTYRNLADLRTSLRNYLGSAFSEDGYVVAPDTVNFYTPPTARDWGSAAPVTTVPPPGAVLPEINELLHHSEL